MQPMPDVTVLSSPAGDPGAFRKFQCTLDQVSAEPGVGSGVFRASPQLPQAPGARITCARAGNEVAGVVATYLADDGSHGFLGGLAVKPAYRGLGIATRLVSDAVADRDTCDGQTLPLVATVRVWPDGRINYASLRALGAAGFVATACIRVNIARFAERAAHWANTVEADGCIRQIVAVRIVPFNVGGCK